MWKYPIQFKARTVQYALKHKIERELQRLQDQGAIEPVNDSDWTTPVVTILKSNGEIIGVELYGPVGLEPSQ